VPLLVLTADRPPELRDCASGQTIDQQRLFGDFPNWYAELATPLARSGHAPLPAADPHPGMAAGHWTRPPGQCISTVPFAIP
jgi:2-succinyl-5-enolpyruvyl-6-hydroxy-3-cyclohexene-1-carboxylate synthase